MGITQKVHYQSHPPYTQSYTRITGDFPWQLLKSRLIFCGSAILFDTVPIECGITTSSATESGYFVAVHFSRGLRALSEHVSMSHLPQLNRLSVA